MREKREMREQVVAVLERMPETLGRILRLHFLDDMSHKEIAEELGISEASSRSQFYRAKSQLKKKITAIISKNKLRQL